MKFNQKLRRATILLAIGSTCVPVLVMGATGARGLGRSCSLTLNNPYWSPSVHVETRIGNNADPNANQSGPTYNIPRNGQVTVTTNGEDVFYRRYNDPQNPNSGWRIWTHQSMSDGHTYSTNMD